MNLLNHILSEINQRATFFQPLSQCVNPNTIPTCSKCATLDLSSMLHLMSYDLSIFMIQKIPDTRYECVLLVLLYKTCESIAVVKATFGLQKELIQLLIRRHYFLFVKKRFPQIWKHLIGKKNPLFQPSKIFRSISWTNTVPCWVWKSVNPSFLYPGILSGRTKL